METDRKRVLAQEALRFARMRLAEKLPFLVEALSVPKVEWTSEASGTDGEKLYWNPKEVCRLYRENPALLERRYLHLLMHGLYLHGFRRTFGQERFWHLACDVLAEYRIDRLDVPGFARPVPQKRSRCYRRIKEAKVPFREQRLAEWFEKQPKEWIQELEGTFCVDHHGYWVNGNAGEGSNRCRETVNPEKLEERLKTVHRWRTVFEQLELREEEHRRQAGGSAGGQVQVITLEKERGYDYRRFLKQFAVSREELYLDTDSFDYIPYDYSRKMYEHLVLLEPLEYKEMQKLEDFVIAIDTSGSCSGEVVRKFLEETWEIFCEKDNFFRRMNLHLIQCDCLIQEHVRITCEEEWKDYLEHMEVKGHGDTDFTPVFRLVEKLREEGELKGLKGLLYFTDGDGIYPAEKPPYETAFVFLNEELRKGKAPDWALTLTLDRELENET